MDPRLIFEICSTSFGVLSGYFALMVRAANEGLRLEVANLRTEIANARAVVAEQRAEERAELLKWINGSFMRAPVVEVRMADFERRMAEIERETRQ